jgi:hypothetical protein
VVLTCSRLFRLPAAAEGSWRRTFINPLPAVDLVVNGEGGHRDHRGGHAAEDEPEALQTFAVGLDGARGELEGRLLFRHADGRIRRELFGYSFGQRLFFRLTGHQQAFGSRLFGVFWRQPLQQALGGGQHVIDGRHGSLLR